MPAGILSFWTFFTATPAESKSDETMHSEEKVK